MPILEDQDWTALVTWIENRLLHTPISLKPHQTMDGGNKGRTKVFIHNRSSDPPISEQFRQQNAGPGNMLLSITNRAATGPSRPASPLPGRENVPLSSSSQNRGTGSAQATAQSQVQLQFRPLNTSEMKWLKDGKILAAKELACLNNGASNLWPQPLQLRNTRFPQSSSEITTYLHEAVGYLQGCAPVSDEIAKDPPPDTFNEPYQCPFSIPKNVALDVQYRGDAIMRGLQSPARNRVESGVQPWKTQCYMLDRQEWNMGAVLEIHDSIGPSNNDHIEVCELQALLILLERQTAFDPKKVVLRAWLVSVKRHRGFRVMEAWVDQSFNTPTFHFTLLGERYWPKIDYGVGVYPQTIDGRTDEWDWLLKWLFAQRNVPKAAGNNARQS
ncbi:hypothetical protein PGQ11_001813 [Apiospora arundinis]|uniref:Uncharacterized protein n=1 Tax=Apiospora arundinis TaxID=335852 RepID=A0ABR2JG78_9PEZI